jgi:uncharacterized protein DUF4864
METNARTILFHIMGCSLLPLLLLCLAVPLHSDEFVNPIREKQLQDKQVYQLVSTFMMDVRKGNSVAAYQTMTSQDFRQTTPLNVFISFVSKYPTLRRNRSMELVDIQYHDNVAVVNVTLMSLEHEVNGVKFILRYEEGRWRVISIQLFPAKVLSSGSDKITPSH